MKKMLLNLLKIFGVCILLLSILIVQRNPSISVICMYSGDHASMADCYRDLSIRDSVSYCAKIGDISKRDSCMLEMRYREISDECDSISNGYLKSVCEQLRQDSILVQENTFLDLSAEEAKLLLLEILPEEEPYLRCFTGVTAENQDYCFRLAANMAEDPHFCSYIEFASYRDFCFMEFVTKGQYELCPLLTDPYLQKACHTLKSKDAN